MKSFSVAAGLPNIIGEIDFVSYYNTQYWNKGTGGAFDKGSTFNGGSNWNQASTSGDNGYNKQHGFSFDASRSNPIYGSSSTVTPLSESCRFYIRY